jgi:predicted DNA-binding transcriptional regulator AlpA
MTTSAQAGARLLSEADVALEYGLRVSTLRSWRLTGRGPRFLKLGASVRYRRADLEAFLESCARSSTSDESARSGGRDDTAR